MRLGTEATFAVIDRSLIALSREKLNRIEIYRLEVCPSTSVPLLQTVCSLGLPPVTPTIPVTWFFFDMEWVPTSMRYKRSRSSRGYHNPFYSCTVGTLGLRLHYRVASAYSFNCTMIISTMGLISAIRTGVHNIPWVDWGPSITHFSRENLSRTAGPFWVLDLSPLTVRSYGHMCMGHVESMAEDMSSSQSRPRPVVFSTKVCGKHWVENQVETHLPYRDIVANDLPVDVIGVVLADREWIVCMEYEVRGFCLESRQTFGSLITCTDRME